MPLVVPPSSLPTPSPSTRVPIRQVAGVTQRQRLLPRWPVRHRHLLTQRLRRGASRPMSHPGRLWAPPSSLMLSVAFETSPTSRTLAETMGTTGTRTMATGLIGTLGPYPSTPTRPSAPSARTSSWTKKTCPSGTLRATRCLCCTVGRPPMWPRRCRPTRPLPRPRPCRSRPLGRRRRHGRRRHSRLRRLAQLHSRRHARGLSSRGGGTRPRWRMRARARSALVGILLPGRLPCGCCQALAVPRRRCLPLRHRRQRRERVHPPQRFGTGGRCPSTWPASRNTC